MVRGVGFCGILPLNCSGSVVFGGDLCVVWGNVLGGIRGLEIWVAEWLLWLEDGSFGCCDR